MDHSEALRITVRKESIGLILICLKAEKEAIHNLNIGQNLVETIYYYFGTKPPEPAKQNTPTKQTKNPQEDK